MFLTISSKRDAESLQNIIIKFVNPGSKIITDCWKGYEYLNLFCFEHFRINHSYHFIDPTDKNIHTQKIERVWKSIRNDIPRATRGRYKKDYLLKFLFFKNKQLKKKEEMFNE